VRLGDRREYFLIEEAPGIKALVHGDFFFTCGSRARKIASKSPLQLGHGRGRFPIRELIHEKDEGGAGGHNVHSLQ
jgi:hypothetical protein